MKAEFARSKRTNSHLVVCYADIDNLKVVNDTLGHFQGDELISSMATIMRQCIRSTDFIVRLGGDEFLICCPQASLTTMEEIWHRIESEISRRNGGHTPFELRVSHGSAQFDPERHESPADLISQADQTMYSEKLQRHSLARPS